MPRYGPLLSKKSGSASSFAVWAIIAGEEDDGLAIDTGATERRQNLTDMAIEARNHGGEGGTGCWLRA
jgi:hypothetical protein